MSLQSFLQFKDAVGYGDREIQIVAGQDRVYRLTLSGGELQLFHCRDVGVLPSGGKDWQPVGAGVDPQILEQKIDQGGIFLRPNRIEGGILNEHFRGSHLLFFEIDDASVEDQWAKIDWMKSLGLSPAAIVFSGGKSLHCYYRLDRELGANDWKRLMRKLCVTLQSDPAICNLNRLMRFPGAYRFKDGQWHLQELLETSSCTYSPEAFESALDALGLFPQSITDDRFRGWKRDGKSHNSKWLRASDAELFPPRSPLPESWGEATKDEIVAAASYYRREAGKGVAGNYEDGLALCGALKTLYGDTEAIAIMEAIAPSIPGKWDVRTKVRTMAGRDEHPEAIVFGVAKRYGYRRQRRPVATESSTPSLGKGGDRRVCKEEWEHGKRLNWLAHVINRLTPHKAIDSALALQQKLFVPKKHTLRVFEYSKGERANTWQAAAKDYKVILDRSGTGAGKSYTSGEMQPSDLEVNQFFYLSNQHRNVTTETLAEWPDLEARHNGLTKEIQPDGTPRLRRRKKDEAFAVVPNCNRIELIDALRLQNVDGADTSALLCGTCPLYESCVHSEGENFGYQFQRRKKLGSPRTRMHPDSAPNPTEFDFSNVAAIWDEFGSEFRPNRPIYVTGKDIKDLINFIIRTNGVEFYSQLEDLLDVLAKLIDPMSTEESNVQKKTLRKYGLDHSQLLEMLPVPSVDSDTLKAAIAPDLSFLNHTLKYGEDLANLPSSVRAQFIESDRSSASDVANKVIKQWAIELVEVLRGNIPGAALHLTYGCLTISLPDPRHRQLAKALKTLIITDATISVPEVAIMLDIDESEIFECRQQEEKGAALQILQVVNIGRCGRQRGNNQKAIIETLINFYRESTKNQSDLAIIDFKGMKEQVDEDGQTTTGAWWVDSRGSNAMQYCKVLILVGTPYRNLASMKAEYAALTGKYPPEQDPGFTAWFNAKTNADIIQGLGRLRANRRPGEQLTCVIISDFNIVGVDLVRIKASDITPEAMTCKERFFHLALQARNALMEAGQKITQSSLARLMGYSQQYLSKKWAELQLLLKEVPISICCRIGPVSAPGSTDLEYEHSGTGEDDGFIEDSSQLHWIFNKLDLKYPSDFNNMQTEDGQI